MVFTIVMLILIVIIAAVVRLAIIRDQEQCERAERDFNEQRERYLSDLRAKYNRPGLPMGFRRRIDFTGERPLTGAELELVKKEVLRG